MQHPHFLLHTNNHSKLARYCYCRSPFVYPRDVSKGPDSSDDESGPPTPAALEEHSKRFPLLVEDDHRSRTRSSSHSHLEAGTPTRNSSRHGSITNSSSSACSVELRRESTTSSGGGDVIGPVCTCPLPSTPTTPTTPPTVVCQMYDYDAICPVAADAGCNYSNSKDKLCNRRAASKPPRSPRSSNASSKSRQGSSSSSSHGHLSATAGRPPDKCGHSAPETDEHDADGREGSGFEWRWFHRRKHSQAKSRSRSSSHLFGGHSPGRTSGIGFRTSPVSSSCCGGVGKAGTGRHGRASSPEQDAESEVYGGELLDASSSSAPPVVTAIPSTVARNGLKRQGKPTARKVPTNPTTVSAVINPVYYSWLRCTMLCLFNISKAAYILQVVIVFCCPSLQ
ncbi:uncharacterized protein LOC118511465 isoform X1 [Anopheles stephensi]|uniref:uncharacterized protein LOC118511465 isoform X1 n=1 Tax=Anopheles stephensi TaxID=30069 RepID=UPI001658791A|nr:uncharacterized protein LOC118511465 isoform X1 [Anopheles stephensi]